MTLQRNVVYTGRHRNELTHIAQIHGGIVQVDFRYQQQSLVESAFLEYSDGVLKLIWNDSMFPCFTTLTEYMFECGVGVTNPDGSLYAGNAANAIFGNYNIFSNSWVGSHTLAEMVGGSCSSNALKMSKAPKQPKATKVSKADQRPMRPANGKAVWNDAYIKAKGIDYADFISKHGKQQVYDDLGSMTVIEFETKYGLR